MRGRYCALHSPLASGPAPYPPAWLPGSSASLPGGSASLPGDVAADAPAAIRTGVARARRKCSTRPPDRARRGGGHDGVDAQKERPASFRRRCRRTPNVSPYSFPQDTHPASDSRWAILIPAVRRSLADCPCLPRHEPDRCPRGQCSERDGGCTRDRVIVLDAPTSERLASIRACAAAPTPPCGRRPCAARAMPGAWSARRSRAGSAG